MLMDRIIGAFTFRKGVYAEVEKDTTFTMTAWIIVVVISFLSQLGTFASTDLVNWLISSLVGTVFSVIGFALAALVISWVGRAVFNAEVTFDELVRTLGLAYVWRVIGLAGGLAAFSTALSCILAPVLIVAAILLIVAWFVAAKEALDLEWLQTIITVILGWIVLFVLSAIAGVILGLLGLTAAGIGSIFGIF